MNPSEPPVPSPVGGSLGRGPSTQEIPVVAPTGASTVTAMAGPALTTSATPTMAAPTMAPLTMAATGMAAGSTMAQATGPVDYLPGPSVAGRKEPTTTAAFPDAEASGEFVVDLSDSPRERRPRMGRRTAALLLGVVAAASLELGLLMHGEAASLWSRTPLWSAFATAAVVAGLAGVAARVTGRRAVAGQVAVSGAAGLGVFWLLVALPDAGTDRGFLLTAALGCLVGAVLASRRSDDATPGTEPDGEPIS